ncbi:MULTISPECIES: MarR family winged helix-turn-helix transcriptional regulator [unclassified Crossiella]|uniref:MarR family winged helix-turn-helix transcriptional regulator n=1 Tax=unclassified Crossiella TaxID=2620835 RepID=UPI001FFF02B7|nr:MULTISPECIES: MarR family transcriptional regulator [unclassified Crossiella]MCK2236480.1 MarR family transcriptional regulator [Crossiella sp. S99.2]MCK2250147.1 MarR family transcriptional regulator [Crossiella sp. S99.1]
MSEPRWLSEAQMRAWVHFLDASRLVEERVAQQLRRDHGITHFEYEVLVRLSATPQRRIRLADLAAQVVAARPRLTHVIDRLQQRGWVRREAVPDDARGYFAVLTPEGYAALESFAPSHVETVRAALIDQLTPGQIDALGDVMSHLSVKLRSDREGGCGWPSAGVRGTGTESG